MALQNILPSYQAEERSAQRSPGFIPHIENGLIGAGRNLTEAGRGLGNATVGIGLALKRRQDELKRRQDEMQRQQKALQDREDSLALAEAKNAYARERTKEMNEFLSLNGAEAHGITKRFEDGNLKALERFNAKLPPSKVREFGIWADQYNLSGEQKLYGHETTSTRQADAELTTQNRDSAIEIGATTGDINQLNIAQQENDHLHELKYGNITTMYNLYENPDVANLSEEDRKGLSLRVKQYEQSRQNVTDSFAGARVQYLVKNGQISEAQRLYNTFNKDGGLTVSEPAMLAMKKVLGEETKVLSATSDATAQMVVVDATDGEYCSGDRYWSDKKTQKQLEIENAYIEAGTPEAMESLKIFRAKCESKKRLAMANFTNDRAEHLVGKYDSDDINMIRRGNIELANEIAQMPDGELRDSLVEFLETQEAKVAAYELQEQISDFTAEKKRQEAIAKTRSNAENDKKRQSLVSRLKLVAGMMNGNTNQFDGLRFGKRDNYDLRNHEQQKLFLKENAFYVDENGEGHGILFPEDIRYFEDLWNGRINNDAREKAAKAVADALNLFASTGKKKETRWDAGNANSAAPELIDEVERMFYYKMETGQELKSMSMGDVNRYIALRLMEEKSVTERFMWIDFLNSDSQYNLAQFLTLGLNADGTPSNDFSGYSYSAWNNNEKKLYQKSEQEARNAARDERYKSMTGSVEETIDNAVEEQKMIRAAKQKKEGAE